MLGSGTPPSATASTSTSRSGPRPRAATRPEPPTRCGKTRSLSAPRPAPASDSTSSPWGPARFSWSWPTRLVTDDISIATLTADLAATYNSIVAGHMPSCQVDERWWEYLTPSTTVPAARRGIPMHWLELAGQMATKGAHAEVDLPLARPIDEHPDTLKAATTTVPWPAAAVPAPALIGAVAQPILACTGTPAWIYLYPDRRPPGHNGAIGPYTARTSSKSRHEETAPKPSNSRS